LDLPEYLTDQTFETILARLLSYVPDNYDKSQGSFVYDALAPVAAELTQATIWAQEVLRRGFAQTTFGTYLDLRAEEHGLSRIPASKATGYITFFGDSGTVIPEGTIVSTPSSELAPAVFFRTTTQAVISDAGEVSVPIEALDEGIEGNVAAGTITVLSTPIQGVARIENEQATSGGADTEDDASLLARYLEWVRNPSAGGNKADYVKWALEVAGVGSVSVVPLKYGNGTVSVAIVDKDMQPASEELVQRVQEHIAPRWLHVNEAESLTISGYGVSVSNGQVILSYSSSGTGKVTHTQFDTMLEQQGVWNVILDLSTTGSGTNDLLSIGIWDLTTNAWAVVDVSSQIQAKTIYSANALNPLSKVYQRFYWNGQDHLELRIERLQTDTVNTVIIDKIAYESLFSKDTGDGKAPIGARVYVEPATAVPINITANISVVQGYDPNAVKLNITEALREYLKSLTFQADNDVKYVKIGGVILDVAGVSDYSNLLINGGTNNIVIGEQEVAVLGTVTFT